MSPTIEDAAALVALVMEDIEAMGFDLHNVRIEVSDRHTKRRLATTWDWEDRIVLYWPLHDGDLDWFEDTIRHEVAHILACREVGVYEHHGPTWRAWAMRLGARPRSTNRQDQVLAYHNEKGKKLWDDQ